jgi:hypothetical protein
MKMTTRIAICSLCAVALGMALTATATAVTVLYQDQMTNAAGWGINKGFDTDSSATFAYDYSADGIPEAPHSQGGDTATSGVKLEANFGDFLEAGSFFTLYPLGQTFSGKHQLRFDSWMNYDAVEKNIGGAVGTTEFLGGGLGYDDVTADVASGAQLIVTGDGGSGSDYRAFKSPPQFFVPAEDMTAGSRNGSDPYYADFLPPEAPPAVQGQAPELGTAGSPGFQWITFEFNVVDDQVSILIEKPSGDRLKILSYDKTDTSDGSSGVDTDGNISIFYADFFSSISPRPDLTFGIVDNVIVSEIPEPTSVLLLGIGALGLLAVNRKNR